jgi:hypothetical protein
MSEEKHKKKRFIKKNGMLFQIPLGNEWFGYGQFHDDIGYAFFDYRDHGESGIDAILKSLFLFKITVDTYVLKECIWTILGVYPVREDLKIRKYTFMIDHKDRVMRWKSDVEQIEITIDEARKEKLEQISAWSPADSGNKKRGRQRKYTDLAIETTHVLRQVYGLPLRQTEGFVASIIAMLKLDIGAPDHTTISRRTTILSFQKSHFPLQKKRL